MYTEILVGYYKILQYPPVDLVEGDGFATIVFIHVGFGGPAIRKWCKKRRMLEAHLDAPKMHLDAPCVWHIFVIFLGFHSHGGTLK